MKYLLFLLLFLQNTLFSQESNANKVMKIFEEKFNKMGEKDAISYLLMQKDEIYPTDITDSIKRILISCPKDALLFTFGNDETYPMLFLQAKFRIRRDVKIINSLLCKDRAYCNFIRGKIFDAHENHLSLSKNFYINNSSDSIIFSNDNNNNFNWKDFISTIENPVGMITHAYPTSTIVSDTKSITITKKVASTTFHTENRTISLSFLLFLDQFANAKKNSQICLTKNYYHHNRDLILTKLKNNGLFYSFE